MALVNGHLVSSVAIIESDITVVDEVVGEPFFYILLLVSGTDDKVIMSVIRIFFHDMPEDWHAANLNHWLWLVL